MKSNLDLINDTDRFPWADASAESQKRLLVSQGLYTLVWRDEAGPYGIGYVLERVVEELLKVPPEVLGEMAAAVDEEARTVEMVFRGAQSNQERTRMVAAVGGYWREKGTFDLLRGWRDELWPVWDRRGNLLFSVERAAMGLLGTMRYGVHMIAYVEDPSAPQGLRIWVPRRAADKSTFPGMLDNTVAGGLMTGEDPLECVVREADEEASLDEELVRGAAVCVGTVTYIYVTEREQVGDEGFIYPECQWVYDLKLAPDVVPQPKDGEVDEFMLYDVDEVRRDLAAGRFKPNCALITIDFLIRHGVLTEENEPDLAIIERRMHREIPFPGPHQEHWGRTMTSQGREEMRLS